MANSRMRETAPAMSARLIVIALAAGLLIGAPPAGAVVLHKCPDGGRWRCGTLSRPLDPARPHGRTIPIAFRWLPPRHAGARLPALVAVEGGPGFPSTGSRVEYTGTYGPLLRERGLLLVDSAGREGRP